MKFVHAALLIFSVVLAFLLVRDMDEKWVLGDATVIWVSNSDNSASGAQVAQLVQSFASDHEIAIVREVPDLEAPGRRRHLYIAAGSDRGSVASWLREGYPQFSRSSDTEVHSIGDIGQLDPRGYYYVYGSADDVDALNAEFADLGLRGELRYPLSFSNLNRVYSNGPLMWAFMVMALAVIMMIGASVLLSAKAYGVLRLQGKSFAEILGRDLRRLGVFWLITAGGLTVAAVLCLWFYNHLAWFGLYTSLAVSFAGVLTVLAVTAHAAILGMLFNTGVLRALKGDLPAGAASFSAYLVRIPALLVALGIATAVVSSGQDLLARQANQDAYRQAGDAVYIRLNGSLGNEGPQMEARVSRWLRQADT